jgi:hypothetical protein
MKHFGLAGEKGFEHASLVRLSTTFAKIQGK